MQKIKINSKNYSEIYFTSDWHFNHDRSFIWEKRGFSSVKEHNESLKNELINLDEDALIINHGDVALMSSFKETFDLFKSIPCQMIYIFGNHESYTGKIYKKHLDDYKKAYNIDTESEFNIFPFSLVYLDVEEPNDVIEYSGIHKDFDTLFVGENTYLKIDKQEIYCSHMASSIWDKKQFGAWHTCGHSHGSYKNINPDSFVDKILDVGCDNSLEYKNSWLFTLENVKEIMSKKQTKIYDHHKE